MPSSSNRSLQLSNREEDSREPPSMPLIFLPLSIRRSNVEIRPPGGQDCLPRHRTIQIGTGKTYAMEGECKKAKTSHKGHLPPHAGVFPRSVKQIFDTLESPNAEYSVKVTFLELYNEEITDLLGPKELSKANVEAKAKKPLLLMEDGKVAVLVRGLEEEIVTSATVLILYLPLQFTSKKLLQKVKSLSNVGS